MEEYELAEVPLYIIVDAVARRRPAPLRVFGYTLTPNGYQPITPNEQGWLWIAVTRTWLGVVDNEIVCFDEAGQPLGNYRALVDALAVEEAARLMAEEQARAEAAARTAEEQARVAAEERAEAAEARAAAAEARVRALEAALRQRGG